MISMSPLVKFYALRITGLLLLIGFIFIVLINTEEDVGAPLTTEEAIVAAQEAYFQQHGEYLQIKKNNELPERYTGTVTNKINATIPNDYEVHIYDGPKGKGFVIRWEDANGRYAQGYGPHASEYTRTDIKQVSATSTP